MSEGFQVLTMADYAARNEAPEVLFWVGCAGSFDDRAKKITKAIAKILYHANVKFAVWEQKNPALEILQNERVMSFYFKCKL